LARGYVFTRRTHWRGTGFELTIGRRKDGGFRQLKEEGFSACSPAVAWVRAQGKHGIKGGRPRLDLTGEERAERRREQKRAYRVRKNGGKPAQPRLSKSDAWYLEIWGKLPGEPLTPEEFAERQPLWNAHLQESIRRDERHEAAKRARRELRRANRKRPSPPPAPVRVGRNAPCPCGSGRKFKKCCGP